MPSYRPDGLATSDRDPQREHDFDFSHTRTVSDIFKMLADMDAAGATVTSQSGSFDAPMLMRAFMKARDRVWSERRDRAGGGDAARRPPALDADTLDEILSAEGVTSAGHYRAGVGAVLNGSEYPSLKGLHLDTKDRVLKEGSYSPARQGSDQEFMARYPQEQFSAKPAADAPDEVREAWIRWKGILEAQGVARQREYQDQQRRWEEYRATIEFDPDDVVLSYPSNAELYRALRSQVGAEDAKAARDEKERSDRKQTFFGQFTRLQSISRMVADSFTRGLHEGEFASMTGLNQIASRRPGGEPHQKVTRTLVLPIPGTEARMTLTLFSDTRPGHFGSPTEVGANFQGIAIEEIAGVPLVGKDVRRPSSPTEMQAFSAALQRLRAVEEQVSEEYGLDLQLSNHLIDNFAPPR